MSESPDSVLNPRTSSGIVEDFYAVRKGPLPVKKTCVVPNCTVHERPTDEDTVEEVPEFNAADMNATASRLEDEQEEPKARRAPRRKANTEE